VLPNEMTYATAIKKSLCTIRMVPQSEGDRYFVATSPIVLCAQLGNALEWPVPPSELLSLCSYKAVLQGGALDTGVPFERVFMFSLMARYALASGIRSLGQWVSMPWRSGLPPFPWSASQHTQRSNLPSGPSSERCRHDRGDHSN